MLRATSVKAAQTWRGEPADTIVLEFDDRHRRRLAMTGTRGLAFLLDLPEVIALRGGDALVLEDGRLIEVVAAAEPLVEIRCIDPMQLVRIAWHLGNRHLPTQLMDKGLRIRRDHVIEDMVRGLGARVIEIEAPFDPEGGAYVSAPQGAAHAHDQPPSPRSRPSWARPRPWPCHDHAHHHHEHDESCEHDHAHHDHTHRIVMGRSKGPRLPVPAADTEAVASSEHAALYRLMTWLSPSFPVGAFSYSSGIEWAVEAGDISDADSLKQWLSAMLLDGAGFCDGVFLCHAWRSSAGQDDAGTGGRRRARRSFYAIARAATGNDGAGTRVRRYRPRRLALRRAGAAVAGLAGTARLSRRSRHVAAGHGIRLDLTLQAFLHAQTANWISAGVRLIPLGQTDSQRVLAALEPVVVSVASAR